MIGRSRRSTSSRRPTAPSPAWHRPMRAVTCRFITASDIKRRYPAAWSGELDQPELAQQAEVVEASPALHDAPVMDAPDVDPGQADGTVRGGHPEDLALLRAARGEVLDDQIALADEQAQVAVPVGEGGAEHGPGRSHSLPVGRHAHRRVVVDEVLGEVVVDGAEVTLGE